MRRRYACVALLGAALLAPSPLAAAGEIQPPTVDFKIRAAPIPGFPGTGNFYGRGASLEFKVDIAGDAGARLLRHANRVALTAKGTFTPIGETPVVVLKRFALTR